MKGSRLVALLALSLLALALAGCGGDGGTVETTASEDAFDRAFIDAMVPHHEAAIEMVEAARAAGLSQPELVEIADAIVAAQQEEIEQMKGYREWWYGSAEIDPEGAAALGLSDEEMGMHHDASALEHADDVDATFAAMMADHHEGAITMARLALDRAEHRELKDLAERIIDAQEREIAVMEEHAGMQHS
jgi:uncharacterized protein (DUF305 family)